jgi:hypothetical protein
VESIFPDASAIRHVLPRRALPGGPNRSAGEFEELATVYPPNGNPVGDARFPARDTLAVTPYLHGRAVDADRLEVLDDHICERTLTEIRCVEAPQFTDAHFAAVVDGYPRPVVEDA